MFIELKKNLSEYELILKFTKKKNDCVCGCRWIAVKGGEIVRTPGLKFPNGFHINLIDRE